MKNKSVISGYILAGGKSSRMGTNKALLTIQNETLLKRMIRLVEPFCHSIAISGNKPDYECYNFQIVPDKYSECGPISGICSTLLQSASDWNLILSVDVPFVNEELISLLIANMGDFDCIIPEHESGIEPLIGLYHKRIVPVLETMILKEEYKLMFMLSKLNVNYVDCTKLTKKYPRLFMNINRPEDFQSI